MSEQPGKSVKNFVEERFSDMRSLHSVLPYSYRNQDIFNIKLLYSFKYFQSWPLAYFKPSAIIQGLISDQHSSLGNEGDPRRDLSLNDHFVDRNYSGDLNLKDFIRDKFFFVWNKMVAALTTTIRRTHQIASREQNNPKVPREHYPHLWLTFAQFKSGGPRGEFFWRNRRPYRTFSRYILHPLLLWYPNCRTWLHGHYLWRK